MAATNFGVIYAVGSAQIRRYYYPQDDNQLATYPLLAGESMVQVARGPYASTAAWQAAVNTAVTNAAGKPPGDPRCAVVNGLNVVVNVINADPALDSIAGMTLVSCYSPLIGIGCIYNPGTTLFTIPSYTIPATTDKKTGQPVAAVVVAAQVIARP